MNPDGTPSGRKPTGDCSLSDEAAIACLPALLAKSERFIRFPFVLFASSLSR